MVIHSSLRKWKTQNDLCGLYLGPSIFFRLNPAPCSNFTDNSFTDFIPDQISFKSVKSNREEKIKSINKCDLKINVHPNVRFPFFSF